MKKILVVISGLFFWASCNFEGSEAKISTAPAPEQGKLVFDVANLSSKKDPVCEMELDNTMLADTALVDGKIYGFCNVGCKDEFKKLHSK